MTANPQSAVQAFLADLLCEHPSARVTCDPPGHASGSTFIDVRIETTLIVVEYSPARGFGFENPRKADDRLYGTPSTYFVCADDAITCFNKTLRAATSVAPSKAQAG